MKVKIHQRREVFVLERSTAMPPTSGLKLTCSHDQSQVFDGRQLTEIVGTVFLEARSQGPRSKKWIFYHVYSRDVGFLLAGLVNASLPMLPGQAVLQSHRMSSTVA